MSAPTMVGYAAARPGEWPGTTIGQLARHVFATRAEAESLARVQGPEWLVVEVHLPEEASRG